MIRLKLILLLMMIFVIAFTGCDFIREKVKYLHENIEDTNKKLSLFKKLIKDNYGLDSKVGWEINNEILTKVTVVFNVDDVRNEQIYKLESASKEAISKLLKSKPKEIIIQITNSFKNEHNKSKK